MILTKRLRLSPLVRLEVLTTARNLGAFDEWNVRLSAVLPAPLDASIARAAEAGMRALATRSAGSHRIPVVDYFVAAAAEAIGGGVLHYDHDYDTLAQVMAFESIWIAPPGSIP